MILLQVNVGGEVLYDVSMGSDFLIRTEVLQDTVRIDRWDFVYQQSFCERSKPLKAKVHPENKENPLSCVHHQNI